MWSCVRSLLALGRGRRRRLPRRCPKERTSSAVSSDRGSTKGEFRKRLGSAAQKTFSTGGATAAALLHPFALLRCCDCSLDNTGNSQRRGSANKIRALVLPMASERVVTLKQAAPGRRASNGHISGKCRHGPVHGSRGTGPYIENSPGYEPRPPGPTDVATRPPQVQLRRPVPVSTKQGTEGDRFRNECWGGQRSRAALWWSAFTYLVLERHCSRILIRGLFEVEKIFQTMCERP